MKGTGFGSRLAALVRKEFKQVARDNSSLLIGAVLPLILILVIGYGISLDVKKVPIAIVLEDASPVAYEVLSFTRGSDYFLPTYVTSMQEAEQLLSERKADAIIRVQRDFASGLYQGNAKLQLILYGVDATTATAVKSYVQAGVGQWETANASKFTATGTAGAITVINRMWFNGENSTTWYFVPGLIVLIMTLVGVFLTALVMAREWERGTLEALFVTPVQPAEILLAKMVPYFCIAMLGFTLCLLASQFLYEIPMQGSLFVIIFCSMLYLLTALGIGLLISSVTKNQFLACQVSLIVSFLPAVMLSGFLFDLRSVPPFISAVGQVLPPTYYMQLLKTLFLAGNNWPLIIKNCLILVFYMVFFWILALKVTKKRI